MSPVDGDGGPLAALAMVTSAIAGRTMEVSAAAEGERTWCDGATVFLEDGISRLEQVQMLAVQASMAAGGSLDPAVLDQLVLRPRLARRYLALEGARALRVNETVLPPAARLLIDTNQADACTTPQASLARARSRGAVADPPQLFGTIDARRAVKAMRRAVLDPLGSPTEAARSQTGAPGADLDDLEVDEAHDLGDLLSSPVGGGGAIGRVLARLLSPTRRRGGHGPPGADAPTHQAPAGASRGDTHWSYTTGAGEIEPALVAGPGGAAMTYAEWDVARRRYRTDWCTVVESQVAPEGSATVTHPSGLTESLCRSLSRLGMGLAPCRRQAQGDDIDIDAAVETYLDTRAGVATGGNLYIEDRRWRRDLGVLVLLDVSGSAGEPGVAGRSVHEHQRLAAAALTEALHALGDRVGLFAFSSRGRQAVQFFGIKSFDEHLEGMVFERLAALQPSAYTRTGAAIRHATDVLERRSGTPRRLLVVLSDGFAYDHGYQGRYGEADARVALTEARRQGVGCVCLSVGALADPAALRRVFGPAAHASVSWPEDLPPLIAPLFRSALRSAEGQHRAFSRRVRSRERLRLQRGRA